MKNKMMKNKRIKKVPVTAVRRAFYAAAGGILFISAVIAGVRLLPPETRMEEETEYIYEVSADISYRVKLLPNQLFSEEWLEEGGVYSGKLTDQIEVTLTADFTGSAQAAVAGAYTVTGIVEGYRETKDSRKVIYERRFPIKEGQAAEDGTGGSAIREAVSLRMERYKQAADEADIILGEAPARRFYLLFEGAFASDTRFGDVQEPFSLSLQIPIQKQEGLYEISGPEPFKKTGQLTSQKEVLAAGPPSEAWLIGIWAALSLAAVIWTLFFTRRPNEEEAYFRQCKTLLRKYGSRMIQLKRMDRKWEDHGTEVSDIENLVLISEEIHRPVCYSPDEKGLPEYGILYVPDEENGYVLRLKKPRTPLEADKKEESGIPES